MSVNMSEEVRKLQTHLSLLREEYVKLQRRLVEAEKNYQVAVAGQKDGSSSDGFVSRLLKTVSDLYGKELYSDLAIKLNGRDIPGHKFVLAARSDYWGPADLSQVTSIDFSHIGLDVSQVMLQWVYTDQCDAINTADDVFLLALLKVAKKYHLDPLAVRCEQSLMASVNVRNCISYYQTSEEIGANNLREHCSQLISSHWNDFTSVDFASMPAPLAYSMFKAKTEYPLHTAIRAQREDVVFLYLVEHDSQLPGKLNEVDGNSDLPLDLALHAHLESIAKTLVKHCVDVNMADHSGCCLLHKAIRRGDDYAATFLIENGADVNTVVPDTKMTPLHLAVSYTAVGGSVSEDTTDLLHVIELLLQHGANPNKQDAELCTALHRAIAANNRAAFSVLLSAGGLDLELRDGSGLTVLWLALNSSSFDLLDNDSFACQLIAHGSSPNTLVNDSGETMLHLAANCSNESAGLFLVNNGANCSAVNDRGETALHAACHHGLVKLVKALLDAGANANAQTTSVGNGNVFRLTPLHVAITAGRIDVIKVLLDFKAQVTHSGHSLQVIPNLTLKDSSSQSALGLSLWTGNRYDIAELLIAGGSNVNDTDSEGHTLLHQAIARNDAQSALFLLKHQADANACSYDGIDCLRAAVRNRLPTVVEALCQKGAKMDARDADKECILWEALASEQFDIADILVRHGCDIDVWSKGPGGCQQTLLHRAIDENKEDIACFLIRSKCDVNSPRQAGPNGEGDEEARDKQSPLHLSAAWGLEKVVQCLMEHNADVNAKDVDQKSPLHIAIENQHHTIISLLLSHPSLNLCIRDRLGATPFLAAMSIRNNKAAQAILDREPTAAEQFDTKGRNFLHLAIQKADLESVLFLLSVHVDVNSRVRDSTQMTPLHLAVISGNEMIARNLLLAGSKVNDITPQKQTALHLAAAHDRAAICSILIDSHVNCDAVDDGINNALHIAVQHGHLNTIRVLLKQSTINAEAINMRGQNILHILGQFGKENAAAIFEFILQCRPQFPIDHLDANGNTVLLLAYFNGNGSLCRAVVKAGAQLGTVNRDGLSIFNTPVATKQLLFKLLDMLVKEPPWCERETCLECGVRFGIKTRKHHCRHCGRILCAKCSEKDMPIIKYNITKPVRVCDICFDVLTLGSSS